MPKLGKSLCNFRNVSLLLMEKSKTITQRCLVKKFLSILWLSKDPVTHMNKGRNFTLKGRCHSCFSELLSTV